jgi:hypothetical protein
VVFSALKRPCVVHISVFSNEEYLIGEIEGNQKQLKGAPRREKKLCAFSAVHSCFDYATVQIP